jgi:hypothetical protein
MNSKVAIATALIFVSAFGVLGEEIYFQGQNQIDTSYDTERERKIVEEWLDLDFYGGPFSLGFQWSAFPYPDPTVSDPEATGFEKLTHRYAELEWGRQRLRVGTFTKLLGRGLALRSYENRDLRIDSNLDGAVYELSCPGRWQLTLLRGSLDTGPMEHFGRRHSGSLSAIDLERNLGRITLGSTTVNHDTPGAASHMGLQTFRGSASNSLIQLDYEGGFRFGDSQDGQGHIFEGSLLFGPFSLFGGYKHYEHFTGLNQGPVLIHDQRATLLNRHPHQLNMDNEKGYLLDLSANTPLGSFLVSYSLTQQLDGGSSENDFTESFLEWDQFFSGDKLLSAHVILDFQKKFVNTPLDHLVEENFITLAGDIRLGLGSLELMLEWEHQHWDSGFVGELDDDLLAAELLASNGWSLSLLTEFLNWTEEQQLLLGEPEIRSRWSGLQLAGPIGDRHELRVFAGGRRAGYICIGGVCRYEPAFDGVELTLLTRF